jgi:hypothetical protein
MTNFLSYTHHLKEKEPSIAHSLGNGKWDLVYGFAWVLGLGEDSLKGSEEKWGLMRKSILGVGFCNSLFW